MKIRSRTRSGRPTRSKVGPLFRLKFPWEEFGWVSADDGKYWLDALKGTGTANGVAPLLTGEIGHVDCGFRFIASAEI